MFPNVFFDRSEFVCRCGCGFDPVDAELMTVLLRLRTYFNEPLTIESGARCLPHNMAVGGSNMSQHLFGKAADITIRNVSTLHLNILLNRWYPDRYGIGAYNTWVHIDVRSAKARWQNIY